MSRAPAVSIVVPTYNRAAFIGDAIASIRNQGMDDLEILVVDDGSTDETEAAVRATGDSVVYLAFEHHGVGAARNRGVTTARGELIAFLDSDDSWPPGSLAARHRHLATHPKTDVVYGRTLVRNTGTVRKRFGGYAEDTPLEFPTLGSMLCRRSVFDVVGLFDEALEHAEDVEWFARMKENAIPTDTIDDITLEYRIHGGNMTLDVDRNQLFLLRALKQTLDRRRG